MEFCIKPINFFGRPCVIICQNENGPCPLLAIANVLLLQGKISISSDVSIISLSELTQIVANAILEKIGESQQPEHVKLVESVLNILPKLARGLDLNVIFSGVNKFEFTEEISVFDALDIQLLHGWICDPNDAETVKVVGNLSYNHLIFRLVEYKSLSLDRKTTESNQTNVVESGAGAQTDTSDKVEPPKDVYGLRREGAVIDKFLTDTAGQFTYPGMLALYNTMQDRHCAVFFRNNHFSTVFFVNGQLFILITDLGYLHEPSVVWEILDRIDGNSEFYNDSFEPLASAQSPGFNQRHVQEFVAAAAGASVSKSSGSTPTSPTAGTICSPPRKAVTPPQAEERTAPEEPADTGVVADNALMSSAVLVDDPTHAETASKPVLDVTAIDTTKSPSASAQIREAEHALFHALKTKHNTPKYSDLHQSTLASQGSAKNKGKISRALAAKAVLATRVDALDDTAVEGGIDDSYEIIDHHEAGEEEGEKEVSMDNVAICAATTEPDPTDDEEVAPLDLPASAADNDPIEATVTPPVPSTADAGSATQPSTEPAAGSEAPSIECAAPLSSIDPDLLLAMQLQEQEDLLAAQHNPAPDPRYNSYCDAQGFRFQAASGHAHSAHSVGATDGAYGSVQGALLSQEERDREHALMLHYQEVQAAEQRRGNGRPPAQQRQQERPPQKGKDKNCVIS